MHPLRVKVVALVIAVCFIVLLLRLSAIQLWFTESFGKDEVNLLEESVAQRTQQLTIHNGRGGFSDRHDQQLTKPTQYDIVLFPFLKDMNVPMNEIAQQFPISTSQLIQTIQLAQEPFYMSDLIHEPVSEEVYTTFVEKNIPGIYPVERKLDVDPKIAAHFLGLVRDTDNQGNNQGISGLEAAFEPFLQADSEEQLLYHVDAKGGPLYGLQVKYQGMEDPYYPVQIKTTIHTPIQQMAEEVIRKHSIHKGGLVLLDVQNRDVLAMVSKPNINDDDPYDQQQTGDEATIHNYMLKATMPGSVFKTVIAAAALEHTSLNTKQMFDCNIGVNGRKPSRKLGTLTFTESFAQSCNHTFVQLAQQMMEQDSEVLDYYVEKLGLDHTVGWQGDVFHLQDFQQFPEEEPSTIWADESHKQDTNLIAHTAIGQQDVQVTPLAVANMMATIASDGMKKEVRGVTSIVYKNGTPMYEFPEQQQSTSRISGYTAKQLQKLLYEVTEHPKGTGKALKGLQVAGKTGTAEDERAEMDYHWFAGFFPYDNPQYAMVVLDLQSDTADSLFQVYKEMVHYLYDQ